MDCLNLLQDLHQRIAIEGIYEQYIQPNEVFFRQNYAASSASWKTARYEECVLDFIPVADKEYLVIDREKGCSCGTFDVVPYDKMAKGKGSFASLLVADQWDFREFMPAVLEKSWAKVYLVLNEGKERFSSFYKVKEFPSMLPHNVEIFSTTEEMYQYFLNNPDIYLPKKVCAPASDGYKELLDNIHSARIQSGILSNNVFLSICIPTYNRGARALNSIKHALKMNYDTEIEIFVSDNGSDSETEEYEAIKNLNDSRVRYYKAEKNEGFVANIYTCLKNAHGHFAIIYSDEDPVILENLEESLDYLSAARDLGGCTFNASNLRGYDKAAEVFPKGIDAVLWACQQNHMAGHCYNIDLLRHYHILEQIDDDMLDNPYAVDYPYAMPFLFLAQDCDMAYTGIALWEFGEKEDHGGICGTPINDQTMRAKHARFEARLEKSEALLGLMESRLAIHDYLKLFLKQVHLVFSGIASGYRQYGEKWVTIYNWIDVCTTYYKTCLSRVQSLGLPQEEREAFIAKIDEEFFDWLDFRKQRQWSAPEENLKSTLRVPIARYCYDKGISFDEIDFGKIDKALESLIKGALMERS